MKRGAKLAALAAVLTVLAASWLVIWSLSVGQEAQAAAAAAEETIDLSVGAAEEVSALSWTYDGQTVSLSYDSKQDAWVNADDALCPIDSEAVQPLVEAVAQAAATREIAEVSDLAAYGLDEPSLVIMAAAGERIVTYQVGNATLDGEYYVRLDGGASVYTETGLLAAAFRVRLSDLLVLDGVPDDIQTVTALTVTTAASSYHLEHMENAADIWYTDAYPWFLTVCTDGGVLPRPLDTEKALSLCALLSDMQLLSCEDWDAQDLAPYGLDDPQGTAALAYLDADGSRQTFSVEFGSYQGGSVYVRLYGSGLVYLADGAALDGLMYPDWDAMEPLAVCPLDWDGVTEAVLTVDGLEYRVVHAVGTQSGYDAETGALTTSVDIYTCGDTSLRTSAVKMLLRGLEALTAESAAPADAGGGTLLTVTFLREGEVWPEVRFTLRDYDSARCLCSVDGAGGYLIARADAEALLQQALELFADAGVTGTEPVPETEASSEADLS